MLEFLDTFEIVRLLSQQQRGEDLLNDSSNAGKGQRRGGHAAHPLPLEEGVRDRGQDGVMLPSRVRAAFEVVEPEFGLEFLVLLFDRPSVDAPVGPIA